MTSTVNGVAPGDLVPEDEPRSDFAARGLALHQVAPHSWLVRTSDPPDGPRSLVACIDENAVGFEVMEMVSGFQWTAFDSLGDVAIYLADKAPQLG
jgi:hypothetical protein